MAPDWLSVTEGAAPLIVSIPHSGTEIPEGILPRLASAWLARKDTDWWVDRLYAFAAGLGATVVSTRMSRTVADVNRDPSGAVLYPGALNTGLCPAITFDAEPLYASGAGPSKAEIDARTREYWAPYHDALAGQIARLRAKHAAIVLFDAHSIRSVVPRLFEGSLPDINIGTNGGASCSPELTQAVAQLCAATDFSYVVNGRFKGGYITRHYGDPARGVHGMQIELAMRGYLREPAAPPGPGTWPPPYDADFAAPLRGTLARVLQACVRFVS